ncbi:nucleoside 2-deoxyribosyltransferase domain-containing protein [Sphingomonas aurantiaca]|uniref:nucleoside 2-deoxyribosyltransferase domain-containing protein n=1 Tax=Sphingomonas aurantiaca TaxID=185949 RepID=UPI0033551D04
MVSKISATAAAVIGALLAQPAVATDADRPGLTVVTSPQPLPADRRAATVFLGGSIDMGKAPDWQREVIEALTDENAVILNPRRADWNPAWRPVADDPNFRTQVEWELSALESADVIVIFLASGSQSPISLLELGLHAREGRLVVYCQKGYWREGNVDITAARYGIRTVSSVDELIGEVRARIRRLRPRSSARARRGAHQTVR